MALMDRSYVLHVLRERNFRHLCRSGRNTGYNPSGHSDCWDDRVSRMVYFPQIWMGDFLLFLPGRSGFILADSSNPSFLVLEQAGFP